MIVSYANGQRPFDCFPLLIVWANGKEEKVDALSKFNSQEFLPLFARARIFRLINLSSIQIEIGFISNRSVGACFSSLRR